VRGCLFLVTGFLENWSKNRNSTVSTCIYGSIIKKAATQSGSTKVFVFARPRGEGGSDMSLAQAGMFQPNHVFKFELDLQEPGLSNCAPVSD